MEEQYPQQQNNPNYQLRNIEEKQKILKDRIILIGQNLIDVREDNNNKITEIKKEIQEIKENMERLTEFFETISKEFSNLAKKEDLEIISKKAKMFEPLEKIKK